MTKRKTGLHTGGPRASQVIEELMRDRKPRTMREIVAATGCEKVSVQWSIKNAVRNAWLVKVGHKEERWPETVRRKGGLFERIACSQSLLYAGGIPEDEEPPKADIDGNAIVGQALASRTPLDLAWAGVMV